MGALAILLAAVALAAGPVNTAPPSITGTARVGGTLTVKPGTWTGNGTISFTFLWQSCDAAGTNCRPWITDPSSSTPELRQTVPNVRAVVGSTLRCVVTAQDADGSASATTPPVKIASGNTPAGVTVTFVAPHNRTTVHVTWLHVVVNVPGNPGKVTIAGLTASPAGGSKLDALVPLKHLGLNRLAIVARYPGRMLQKTLTVRLTYPSLFVTHAGPFGRKTWGLGCDPCKIADPPSDGGGGADIDWATSSHSGGRLVHTIHVRNSLNAGGANVCLFVSTPGQRSVPGISVGCYGPKLNDGSRDHGPATIRTLNAHTLQISFAASQLGSPPWYLWRVWSHAGDHLTYDTVPNGDLFSKTAGQVKQQLRFEVGRPPSG